MKRNNMYYEKKDSEDLAIVGDYPLQVYSFIKGYNKDGPNSVYSLSKYHSSLPPQGLIPDLDGFKMTQKAKLTDFVSTSIGAPWNNIISPKAWEVISKLSLPPYYIYPMGLYKRNIKYDYFWLTILSIDSTDIIDYKKSNFEIVKRVDPSCRKEIKITSLEDLKNKREKMDEKFHHKYRIEGIEITIKRGIKIPFDIFDFNFAPIHGEFVSERYKNVIEENKLTGLEFEPADNLKFQI